MYPIMARQTWPIIVGGCYRSGTSLVRRILNAHSHIHCGPEVKFFRDFYGDYFSDPIKHLRFTTSARSLLPEADLLELLGQTFIALHERAAMRAGKSRWADKNPENVLYLEQWRQLLGGDWLMIHVARNPLDTLASMKETSFPLTLPADLDGRILLYLRYNRAALDFADAYPNRYHRILYEKLVYFPERVLQSLMVWLGEVFETRQLKFNDQPQQAGLEDQKIAKTSRIQAERVGCWRNQLSDHEAETIWRATEEIWNLMDYAKDSSEQRG
jgi:hypothetical protein